MRFKFLGMLILASILCMNLIAAAEGDYISSFDISGESGAAMGLTTDGLNIFVLDGSTYKYTMDGTYTTTSFDTDTITTQTYGLGTDDISFFVGDPTKNTIFNFSIGSFDSASTSNFSTIDDIYGVTSDGTNIWIANTIKEKAIKYTLAGVHVSNFSLAGQTEDCQGITTDGTNIWVVAGNGSVYKYDMDGVYVSHFNTSADWATGITTDGNYIWVVDRTNDEVYKYEGGEVTTEITINLTSPVNNAALSVAGTNFTANYTVTNYNFTNTTYHIWNSTGDVVNNSVITIITGTSNSSTEYIDGLTIGDFEWNVFACWKNATFSNCSFAYSNYTLTVGAGITSITYNNNTYETSSETFAASFEILEGAEISLVQLVYNGTNHTVLDTTTTDITFEISKTIDIPININTFGTDTKSFFFRFTYEGDQVQETATYTQNVSYINLQICNTTYSIHSINFSLKDEITQSLIDPAANSTNAQAIFEYWLGAGTKVKNYTFSRLSSATNNTYKICIFPNSTFKVDMDMVYSAQAYDERTYILRNASITNVTSVIDLFLLYENLATKFTIEVRQGVSILTDAVITVARFFIGEGAHRTVSIRETDAAGQFVEYLDLDNDYRYSIVKNGVLLGIIDKKATCVEAPCEFTLQIAEDTGNIFKGYEDAYARNVYSNLSFDIDTKIVSYDFIDITGLAQYFRLRVTRGAYNGTGVEICNQQVFSSSGSMTCNVTGYEGNFVAVGTVSRSPELLDKILEFVLGSLRDSLGLMAIVFSFAIILTLTIAGAVLSGGNPSMVLGGFGLGLLATKLMTILPFSWGLVALFELIILIIMGWLKT